MDEKDIALSVYKIVKNDKKLLCMLCCDLVLNNNCNLFVSCLNIIDNFDDFIYCFKSRLRDDNIKISYEFIDALFNDESIDDFNKFRLLSIFETKTIDIYPNTTHILQMICRKKDKIEQYVHYLCDLENLRTFNILICKYGAQLLDSLLEKCTKQYYNCVIKRILSFDSGTIIDKYVNDYLVHPYFDYEYFFDNNNNNCLLEGLMKFNVCDVNRIIKVILIAMSNNNLIQLITILNIIYNQIVEHYDIIENLDGFTDKVINKFVNILLADTYDKKLNHYIVSIILIWLENDQKCLFNENVYKKIKEYSRKIDYDKLDKLDKLLK